MQLRAIIPLCLFAIAPIAFASDAGAPKDAPTLMCERGKVLISDDFSAATIAKEWRVSKGTWTITDGALKGVELKSDMHAAVVRRELKARNFIVQFSFRFDGGRQVGLSINDTKGHVCRAILTPGLVSLVKDKPDKNGPEKPAVLDRQSLALKAGEWHTAVIEVFGKEMAGTIDGQTILFGANDGIDVEKANFGFPIAGDGVSIDNVRVWEASAKSDWPAKRQKLQAEHGKGTAAAAK